MTDTREAYQATLERLQKEKGDALSRVAQIEAAIKLIKEMIEAEPSLQPQENGSLASADTMIEAAEEALRQIGQPTHIGRLVRYMKSHGFQPDRPTKEIRVSLVGSLDRAVRAGRTFMKPARAVYALIEWQDSGGGQSG